MFKRENIYERGLEELPEQEEAETPRPKLLDVVKIDGRWAQVVLGGDTVRFLDNQDVVDIDWNDYVLTKKWKTGFNVGTIKGIELFTEEELKNIHYGPEEERQNFNYKGEVNIFGDYIIKEKINKKAN